MTKYRGQISFDVEMDIDDSEAALAYARRVVSDGQIDEDSEGDYAAALAMITVWQNQLFDFVQTHHGDGVRVGFLGADGGPMPWEEWADRPRIEPNS